MKVEIVLSSVIALSTVLYTGINLMLWFESKATRRQKLTPQVIAFLKSAETHIMLELHIKNIGEGVAKNLKIKVLQDYKQLGKEDLLLSQVGAIKNGFELFPPQYELKYYINSLVDLFKEDKNGKVKLELSYESSDHRKFHDVFELSFNQLFGQNYSTPPESFIGQISFYLKEINSTLKKIEEKSDSVNG